jgi:transposase-like protein
MKLQPGAKRRDFSKQFKMDAVRRVMTECGPDFPIAQLAKELDLFDSSLHEWRKAYGDEVQAILDAEAETPETPTNENRGTIISMGELTPEEEEMIQMSRDYLTSTDDKLMFPNRFVQITVEVPEFLVPLHNDQIDRLLVFVRQELVQKFGSGED